MKPKTQAQLLRPKHKVKHVRSTSTMLPTLLPKPPGIRPANPLHNSQLALHSRPDIHQIIDLLQELAIDLARQNPLSILAQDVDFAEEQPVLFVGQHAIVGGSCGGEDAVDVSAVY